MEFIALRRELVMENDVQYLKHMLTTQKKHPTIFKEEMDLFREIFSFEEYYQWKDKFGIDLDIFI